MTLNRRAFLGSVLAGYGAAGARPAAASVLDPWKPGNLDIHHLAYGRGNSTFLLCPDGTTMLIDAGATDDAPEVSSPQMPNSQRRPGEWIAAYALRHMLPAGRRELDYFLLTHIHPDHLGAVTPDSPSSSRGPYRLTGVTDVDAQIRIGRVLDRGFPDYNYPTPQEAPFALNYIRFVRSRAGAGEACERVRPGKRNQIRLLRDPERYPDFEVRNLAANGEVWTGAGETARSRFPDPRNLRPQDYPTENMCSVAIRLSYGKFDYYTGGDLTCDIEEGCCDWRDIETPVARAAGPVEVAVANHHGYFDAVGPEFVRALRPRVFIVPAWYVAHPGIQQLRRMLSAKLDPEGADVFATNVMPANRQVNNQFISKLKSLEGHIIVRVEPRGEEFRVIVCDNTDDLGRVQAAYGPYRCS